MLDLLPNNMAKHAQKLRKFVPQKNRCYRRIGRADDRVHSASGFKPFNISAALRKA